MSVAHGGAATLAMSDRQGIPTPAEAPADVPPGDAGPRPAAGRWLWLGLHGGSGVTTLAEAVPGGVDLGGLHGKPPPLPVVAVCRSHAAGLGAAQEWAPRAVHDLGAQLTILGLVVVADAPGPLPRGLKLGVRLVRGAYRHLWQVPWVPAWRVGQSVPPEHLPGAVRRLANDLAAMTAREGGK